jgi:hypothetical protein
MREPGPGQEPAREVEAQGPPRDGPVACQVCGARQPKDTPVFCHVCGEPVLAGGWAP